ncbi:MAG TPA: methylamine utilization protein [Caulobacteraceae bacterium]|nr:methylamine utilization protein [Caulobacteraceae bacterium]
MRSVLGLLLALSTAASAQAADLTVFVRTAQGKPVANAVVTAYPNGAYDKSRIRFSWPYRVSQHDLTFDPFVLIVPVGSEVSFPNQDSVRHHVYSFSPAKTFELKLYGQDETRTVRFDRAGVVALGCNIHDQMSAFIVVVDTPFAAKTDAAGLATLRGMTGDQARLQIWHPYAKAKGNAVAQTASMTAGKVVVNLDLRPAPKHGAY